MKEQSVFKELSRYMPEKEREELLSKLKRSLYVPEEVEERKYHREIDKNEREEKLLKDLNKVSFFSRILLWIKSKLSGKTIREMYLNTRIKHFKKNIASKYPGLTGFETRDLTPKVAEMVFGVYTLTVPLRDIFRRIWINSEDLEGMLVTLLEKRIPNPKKNLTDLVPLETLEKNFLESGTKEAMRDLVAKSLETYFDSLPKDISRDLERDLLPVTCTKDLILFQYKSFFQLFHFTPADGDLEKKTFFKNASAMLCLQHLERLHYALSQAILLKDATEIPEDVLAYMTELKKNIEAEGDEKLTAGLQDQTDDIGKEDNEGRERGEIDKGIEVSLRRLTAKAAAAHRSLPLEMLVKYFMKDPYHELVTNTPELRVKELYGSVFRLKIFAELEKIFPEIRQRVVEKEIQVLFEGKSMIHFRNYREYESIDYNKLGLPFFRFTRSLHLLFNYARHFYKEYIRDAVQVLERGILSQNRITNDRLLQYAAAVEDIENRAVSFDYSLSVDSEDGKLFQRLRFTLAQDKSHQRMYRTLVLQKDREVQAIIDRSLDALRGLATVFDDIISSKSDALSSQLNTHYFIKGKPVPLHQILAERKGHLKKFAELLDQVMKLEKG
ncbi:MAG: hypothetical protein JW852_11600 [Spirochaetales bacterium]|nr:hypothetical protein [Spirochaetales bacterium]